MLYYDFFDYKDFQERFGIVHHGNGAKNRKNKILLAYIKNRDLLRQARETNDYTLLHISSMSELKQVLIERIQDSSANKKYPVQLINTSLKSDQYQTDENKGLCEDGDFKAVRYIIYNKCYDEDGIVWRLAERQYSTDCNDVLKRALIDALIREGKIDGYKKVGAGCCDEREFVDVNGRSLAHKVFHIDCDLETDDNLSYQDSFKYYSISERKAYNCPKDNTYYNLDTTDGSIDGEEDDDDYNYDDYHDYTTRNDTVTVLYRGHEISCDETRLEDFNWSERDQIYIHKDEAAHCELCDGFYPNDDGVFSEITKEYYCCVNCKETAEQEYKEENWFWSEYDHQYFENEDEITEIYRWNKTIKDYEAFTISKKTLDTLVQRKEAFVYEGEFYDTINKRTGKPFFYYRKKMAA